MLTPEQLAARSKGLGGSDAPAVIEGIDTYRSHTALDVYASKVLGATKPRSAAMDRGNVIEPMIRALAAHELGIRIDEPKETFAHPEHPWMLANLDGITSDGGIFEAKAINWIKARELGEPGTDFTLPGHFIQVQHYMEVKSLPFTHVAYFVGPFDLRLFVVMRDTELGGMLVEREGRFWREHVEARVPPEPVDADAALRFHAARYPDATVEELRAAPGSSAEEALRELRAARVATKAAKGAEKLARARVEELMGSAYRIECDFGRVTWSNSRSVAWAAVAREAGAPKALIEKHTKNNRRFLPAFHGESTDSSEE